jgi:hypothetical protein
MGIILIPGGARAAPARPRGLDAAPRGAPVQSRCGVAANYQSAAGAPGAAGPPGGLRMILIPILNSTPIRALLRMILNCKCTSKYSAWACNPARGMCRVWTGGEVSG